MDEKEAADISSFPRKRAHSHFRSRRLNLNQLAQV